MDFQLIIFQIFFELPYTYVMLHNELEMNKYKISLKEMR